MPTPGQTDIWSAGYGSTPFSIVGSVVRRAAKMASIRNGTRLENGLPACHRLRHLHMFTNAQTRVSDCRMLRCVGSWIASVHVLLVAALVLFVVGLLNGRRSLA